MTYTTVQLGNVNADMLQPDANETLQAFIRSRAARLGLDLSDYDVSIDTASGTITATKKEFTDPVEINYT